jgi:hypothetical protein
MIPAAQKGRRGMKLIIAAAIGMLALAPAAQAQERAGPAALGALAGAVVLGPVGLVAGAAIGYTAGPEIGRAWKVRRVDPQHRAKRTGKQPARVAARERAPAAQPGTVAPATPAPGAGGPAAQGFD